MEKILSRSTDPETGYIGRDHIAEDFGPEVRCCRCGGKGAWQPPYPLGILCLQCADEFFESGILIRELDRVGYVWSKKKHETAYKTAFEQFCKIEPKQINIEVHNSRIRSNDTLVRTMFPQYFQNSD